MRVFLSSTRKGLIDEREAVYAVLKEHYEVVRMEDFGSRGTTALATCLTELEACDVCVLLLDHHYGTIVPRYNASYTETEYEQARLIGIEVLAYIKADFETEWPKADHPERLKDFKESLDRAQTIVRPFFRDQSELAERVATDLDAYAARRKKRPSFRPRLGSIRDPRAYGVGSWRHKRLQLNPYILTIVEVPVMDAETYPKGKGRRLMRKMFDVYNDARAEGANVIIFNDIDVMGTGSALDQHVDETRKRAHGIVCFLKGEADIPNLKRLEGAKGKLIVFHPEGMPLPPDLPDGLYGAYTDEELENCELAIRAAGKVQALIWSHLEQSF